MDGNPLNTKLCEEYGCEIPVVAFAHTKDVIRMPVGLEYLGQPDLSQMNYDQIFAGFGTKLVISRLVLIC